MFARRTWSRSAATRSASTGATGTTPASGRGSTCSKCATSNPRERPRADALTRCVEALIPPHPSPEASHGNKARPPRGHRRRLAHALREVRHCLQGVDRARSGTHRRLGAGAALGAARQGDRPDRLRRGDPHRAVAEHRPRGRALRRATQDHRSALGGAGLRHQPAGAHHRGRRDRPGRGRRGHRRRRRGAERRAHHLLAAGRAGGGCGGQGEDAGRQAQGLPRDLLPVPPAIAEYSTGLSMGESAEKMAKENGISREAQDAWAHRSHSRAARAWEEGTCGKEVMRVLVPPRFEEVAVEDNVVRKDSKLEAYANLKPVFDKKYGSVTAGNSSPLTDGSAAL